MSEIQRHKEEPNDRGNPTTAYTTAAIGVALLVAAVLVMITAGTAAAGVGLIIGGAACIGWGVPEILSHRQGLPSSNSSEKQLLGAIRDSGGSITPAEAAMETSLTVREADKMLSELAGGGHLAVESRGGSLFYSLPNRGDRALEER